MIKRWRRKKSLAGSLAGGENQGSHNFLNVLQELQKHFFSDRTLSVSNEWSQRMFCQLVCAWEWGVQHPLENFILLCFCQTDIENVKHYFFARWAEVQQKWLYLSLVQKKVRIRVSMIEYKVLVSQAKNVCLREGFTTGTCYTWI